MGFFIHLGYGTCGERAFGLVLCQQGYEVYSFIQGDAGYGNRRGELLSRLRPFPEIVCATEAYAPNVPIAKERLEPLGVRVMAIQDDNSLPFGDAGFDLVLNKHESFSPTEVRRILRPGGTFLTQQVGAWIVRASTTVWERLITSMRTGPSLKHLQV